MGQMTFLACYLLSHLNLDGSSAWRSGLANRAPCWRFWGSDFQCKGLGDQLEDNQHIGEMEGMFLTDRTSQYDLKGFQQHFTTF